MKITDMLVSAIVKKGILYEARNVDVEFTIPKETDFLVKDAERAKLKFENVTVRFKAEHMSIKIEKDLAG